MPRLTSAAAGAPLPPAAPRSVAPPGPGPVASAAVPQSVQGQDPEGQKNDFILWLHRRSCLAENGTQRDPQISARIMNHASHPEEHGLCQTQ